MIELNKIYNKDCYEVLKKMPSNSIDLIVTDPPYGYSFMGKQWDKALPKLAIWQECLRVLKPGAFALIMAAPRQDVLGRMIRKLNKAGFDIGFTSIYWTYATGFPKAMNISKAIDKRLGMKRKVIGKDKTRGRHDSGRYRFNNGDVEDKNEFNITESASDLAKQYDGAYGGFQPKPAVEVIIVVMKPLSERGYLNQVMKNGKGITWLDRCRIPTGDKLSKSVSGGSEGLGMCIKGHLYKPNKQGRFPANLLVSDDVLNDGKITKSTGRKLNPNKSEWIQNSVNYGANQKRKASNICDKCSYSRYFDLDKWYEKQIEKTFPFLIVPKPSRSEKNLGCEDMEVKQVNDGRNKLPDNAFQRGKTYRKNTHPTVKPLKLMMYLTILGSKQSDIILDPFLGSGTTAIAAKLLKRNVIGIEQNKEYMPIIKARVQAINQYKEKFLREVKKNGT